MKNSFNGGCEFWAAQTVRGKVMWNKTNVPQGSRSIHTFLSITMRFLGYSTTATVGRVSVEMSGPARRGTELPALLNFLTASQTAASPYHFPITGQLVDLLALACETPSRGWNKSQDWSSLVRKGAGAQARSLLEGRYNEKLPVAGSVIKLFS